MKKTTFIILGFFVLGLFSFCKEKKASESTPLEIEIPSDYSGWCYVVGSTNPALINNAGKNVMNKEGILYLDTASFHKIISLKILKNGKDITDNEAKFSSATWISPPDATITASNTSLLVYSFYVLNKEDLKKTDGFWSDSKSVSNYKKAQSMRLDSLMRSGKIK
ncbi:MAG: hypothetical protein JWP12_1905 [Bacteroidetes bacterium]|nr:hypothetical protein [Bacteroidota bacterium]